MTDAFAELASDPSARALDVKVRGAGSADGFPSALSRHLTRLRQNKAHAGSARRHAPGAGEEQVSVTKMLVMMRALQGRF